MPQLYALKLHIEGATSQQLWKLSEHEIPKTSNGKVITEFQLEELERKYLIVRKSRW